MTEDPLAHFIEHEIYDKYRYDLISRMRGMLTEEQFSECLRGMFGEMCRDRSDVVWEVKSCIEQTWDDIDLFYDEDEDDHTLPDITCYLKDRFYFVEMMFLVGLTDDAEAYCRRIIDALESVSKDPKLKEYSETLIQERDELIDCIERKDYVTWFDY